MCNCEDLGANDINPALVVFVHFHFRGVVLYQGIKLGASSGSDYGRNSGSREGRSPVDMIVLCHYNEGRVLLTDEDGMYNDFILEACRVTGKGRTVIAASLRAYRMIPESHESVSKCKQKSRFKITINVNIT